MALRGVRGATVADNNIKEDIVNETKALLNDLIEKNNIEVPDIASIFFSVTQDLNAEFPAVAARQLGLKSTPLLCLNEIPVTGSLERCIRILMHVNSDRPQDAMNHCYLKGAVVLRPDQAA